jgi:hypothetical protein
MRNQLEASLREIRVTVNTIVRAVQRLSSKLKF